MKEKTKFVCGECGYETVKWMGRRTRKAQHTFGGRNVLPRGDARLGE